jgi:predicted Zn-dependent peptidase
MLYLRHNSSTATPASPSLSMATIFDSLNLLFFISEPPASFKLTENSSFEQSYFRGWLPDNYVDKINTVTLEQVKDAFKKHLNVDEMITVTVGKTL